VQDDGTVAPTGSPGELFVRTGLAMDGYHKTTEQLTELASGDASEWKSVGDVAYVDDEGYVYICDRIKDMIISGGVNIYPAEIEAVLHGHPAVLDVAVFGIPDEEWGESVKAAVELADGFEPSPELEAQILAFGREHLAGFKVPRSVDFEDELPRYPTGKLYTRVLRDKYWKDVDRSI
jgi:long-chain acyl-CoA synthetase